MGAVSPKDALHWMSLHVRERAQLACSICFESELKALVWVRMLAIDQAAFADCKMAAQRMPSCLGRPGGPCFHTLDWASIKKDICHPAPQRGYSHGTFVLLLLICRGKVSNRASLRFARPTFARCCRNQPAKVACRQPDHPAKKIIFTRFPQGFLNETGDIRAPLFDYPKIDLSPGFSCWGNELLLGLSLPGVSMTLKTWGHPKSWGHGPLFQGSCREGGSFPRKEN